MDEDDPKMLAKPAGDAAETLIQWLQGSCNTMPDWVYQHKAEDEILGLVDNEIFLCACCGWWCEMSEANPGPDDEDVCADCL